MRINNHEKGEGDTQETLDHFPTTNYHNLEIWGVEISSARSFQWAFHAEMSWCVAEMANRESNSWDSWWHHSEAAEANESRLQLTITKLSSAGICSKSLKNFHQQNHPSFFSQVNHCPLSIITIINHPFFCVGGGGIDQCPLDWSAASLQAPPLHHQNTTSKRGWRVARGVVVLVVLPS